MSRGNINQIGQNAWASMIDFVQEMVLDVINDARTEFSKDQVYNLSTAISDKTAEMVHWKEEKFYSNLEDEQLCNIERDFDALAEELDTLYKQFDTKVHHNTFPQFINDSVPRDMYSVTYNNSWDLCYGYMTTCMKAKDMEKWYENAAEHKDNPKVKIDYKEQINAKEAIRTLSQCYNHPSYYTCSCKPGSTCPLPNTKRTPDVVVTILPEDNTKYLKIPVFVFKVIGSKEIRGKNERQFPGFVTTLQSLAFSPYAYYGEVDEDTVTLYHFQKKPEEGRIEITEESFTYADYNPGAMAMAFGNIIETLTDIFVDIYLNLSWVNHEISRLMKLAEYKDFVAATDGNHEKELKCIAGIYLNLKSFAQISMNHQSRLWLTNVTLLIQMTRRIHLWNLDFIPSKEMK